jgi:hypothetical protein
MLVTNGLQTHAEPVSPGADEQAGVPPSLSLPSPSLLQYVVGAYPPDLALRLLTFASALPAEQAKSFLQLLQAVDDAAVARVTEAEQVDWQQLRAHLPGLAPTLDLLRAHIQGTEPPCTPDGDCPLGT